MILQPEPLMSKVNAVDVIFCSRASFVQPELQLISDMSIRIYSVASMAENRMLRAVLCRPGKHGPGKLKGVLFRLSALCLRFPDVLRKL